MLWCYFNIILVQLVGCYVLCLLHMLWLNYFVAVICSKKILLHFFLTTEGKYYYGVRIVTGHNVTCNATPFDVFFSLGHGTLKTESISLNRLQSLMTTSAFNKGTHVDMIVETDSDMGDVQVVGVGLKPGLIARFLLINHRWYVAFISIINFQKDEVEHHFPCYHWLGYDDGELTVSAKTCKFLIDYVPSCIAPDIKFTK